MLIRVAQHDLSAHLVRHTPVLRYDSGECYRASSVTSQNLNAATAQSHSWIATTGGRWRRKAHPVEEQPGHAGCVYGHAASGSDGRIWLSYWFFYLYNDYTLVGPFLGAGRHEGDWEMIQLRLDSAGERPDLALYAQHQRVQARAWGQVERISEQPVVYVARGCHACYFSPGWHWTGVWFDRANGQEPAPELALEVISDGDPGSEWVYWPGRWGRTQPGRGIGKLLGLDASSPRGPGHQRQWEDPARLLGWVTPRRRRRSRR